MPSVSALRKDQPAQACLKKPPALCAPAATQIYIYIKTLVVALHVGIQKRHSRHACKVKIIESNLVLRVRAMPRFLIPRQSRALPGATCVYQVGRVYSTNHIRRTYLTTAPARMHDGVGDHLLFKIHNRASRPTRRAGGTA
jgi:hypothetical protein